MTWPDTLVQERELALRNKAMPLEALRYDLTPNGMHYTLIHYDVPWVDAAAWHLQFGGQVRTPLSLTLLEIQHRPARTLRVTLECAGDGRALLHPRALSQPRWTGAVGTAEWTGTPLGLLLEEAGDGEGVTEIVFTGLDHGVERGVEQDYQRSLPLDVALDEDVLLAWAMNGPRWSHNTGIRCASSCPVGTAWPTSSGCTRLRLAPSPLRATSRL
jgi:DMSO/TMAO reductase YedYZ molybdopterin-dependent catalytic subunit